MYISIVHFSPHSTAEKTLDREQINIIQKLSINVRKKEYLVCDLCDTSFNQSSYKNIVWYFDISNAFKMILFRSGASDICESLERPRFPNRQVSKWLSIQENVTSSQSSFESVKIDVVFLRRGFHSLFS